jgi:hypothetical protein
VIRRDYSFANSCAAVIMPRYAAHINLLGGFRRDISFFSADVI